MSIGAPSAPVSSARVVSRKPQTTLLRNIRVVFALPARMSATRPTAISRLNDARAVAISSGKRERSVSTPIGRLVAGLIVASAISSWVMPPIAAIAQTASR